MQTIDNEEWMKLALKQAYYSIKDNEVPVGAIIILDNKIISSGYNQCVTKNDPTAHAEILAIKRAESLLKNYRLNNCEIYTTLEPCSMCYGAIIHARIRKITFGAYDPKTGVCGSCMDLSQSQCYNHKPEIIGGVMESECSEILKSFFQIKRRI